MTRPKQDVAQQIGEIDPGAFYRTTLAPAIFGIGWQSARNKVLAGELPVPYGEPQGWDGSQIISYRTRMKAIAEAKAAADAARPKQEQPAGFRKKTKTKKVKFGARVPTPEMQTLRRRSRQRRIHNHKSIGRRSTMATSLEQLGKKAKAEIRSGDRLSSNAEKHYLRAGKYLVEAKAKVDHGGWLPYLKKHGIAERTAQTYMALASGKITLEEIRAKDQERNQTRGKSAGPADLPDPKLVVDAEIQRMKEAYSLPDDKVKAKKPAPIVEADKDKESEPVKATPVVTDPEPVAYDGTIRRIMDELRDCLDHIPDEQWFDVINEVGAIRFRQVVRELQAVCDQHCPEPAETSDAEPAAAEATRPRKLHS